MTLLAVAAGACGDGETPPDAPLASMSSGVLSRDWIYRPATPDALEATGLLKVEPGVSATGPVRLLLGARGVRLSAALAGPASMDMRMDAQTIGEALDARGSGSAMVFRVTEGNLCSGGRQATHLIWYEPEMIEGRTLTLAVVAGGALGESGSTICRVLRYTRDREPSVEARQ